MRTACRIRHFSRTEDAYVGWIRRFILFHRSVTPPRWETAVTAFISSLATDSQVSASTQNQALNALLFLYRAVLQRELEPFHGIVRPHARQAARRPHARRGGRLLAELHGVPRLVASLLYGSGLRLLECLELRIKDVDLARQTLSERLVPAGSVGDGDARAEAAPGPPSRITCAHRKPSSCASFEILVPFVSFVAAGRGQRQAAASAT